MAAVLADTKQKNIAATENRNIKASGSELKKNKRRLKIRKRRKIISLRVLKVEPRLWILSYQV